MYFIILFQRGYFWYNTIPREFLHPLCVCVCVDDCNIVTGKFLDGNLSRSVSLSLSVRANAVIDAATVYYGFVSLTPVRLFNRPYTGARRRRRRPELQSHGTDH